MALTLREWRLAKEMTKGDMSSVMGISIPTYNKLEENTDLVTIGQAKAVAEFLNISVDDIIFFGEMSTKCNDLN